MLDGIMARRSRWDYTCWKSRSGHAEGTVIDWGGSGAHTGNEAASRGNEAASAARAPVSAEAKKPSVPRQAPVSTSIGLENLEEVHESCVAMRRRQEPHVAVRVRMQPPGQPGARRARRSWLGAHQALLN